MSKKLKEISLVEIEFIIHDHQLRLRWGDESKRANFSWYNFLSSAKKYKTDARNFYNVFENKELKWAIMEGIVLSDFSFFNSDLSSVSFQNSLLLGCNFKGCNLGKTDFRDAMYDFSQFSEEQKETAIFTDKEYLASQKIKEQEIEIEKKDKVIENTKDEQTDLLKDGFDKIREDFSLEEKRWLMISFMWFLNLFLLSLVPILDIIAYKHIYKIIFWWLILTTFIFITWSVTIASTALRKNQELEDLSIWEWIKKEWKNILVTVLIYWLLTWAMRSLGEPDASIFSITIKYCLIPFWILFSTFLYFSVLQYSKAKELRIENQNKIALLHGLQAINANELITNKEIFHQNIADVVFTKAYREKNPQNLPIDKVIDLIKLSKK